MITALALCVLAQSTYVIKPATDYMTDTQLDEFVNDARVQHKEEGKVDPLWLIRMVNQLQPMGKDKALALIKEIDTRKVRTDNSSGEKVGDDLYWLVNLLFDPPPRQAMPVPGLGSIYPIAPKETERRAPRWPILLYGEFPLCVIMSTDINGKPESWENYTIRVAETCTWRTRKLRPVNDPFDAFDRLQRDPVYMEILKNVRSGDFEGVIAPQLAKLVRTALPSRRIPRSEATGAGAIAIYKNYYQMLMGARWEDDYQFYVRKDGKYDKDW